MSFTIASIQNSKLRTLATTVDSTFNGKTKNNKIIDDCEIPIFEAQVKAKGLGNEYAEFLKIYKQAAKTAESTDSANHARTDEKSDVDNSNAEKIRLETKIQTAKSKVNNLRKKLSELEKKPTYKENYQIKGGTIGLYTAGGLAGLGTLGYAIASEEVLLLIGGTIVCPVLAVVGGFVGAGIGTAVYYMSKSDEEEKKYDGNINNQKEKIKKDLKATEVELKKYEIELQHLKNKYNL